MQDVVVKPNILVAFGTRPEAIKMLPVVGELRRSDRFKTTVVVTGQHRSMLDQVFASFKQTPDIDLNLMTFDQTLSQVTARVITEMSLVYSKIAPSVVLVHGDTTTAMAAAVAAFYCRVKVGHVESGLRSHDLKNPWPEEFNRVTIDTLADFRFAPTAGSAENLLHEYSRNGKIIVTGNTGIDAVLRMAETLGNDTDENSILRDKYGYLDDSKRLVLVTAHRRESFGSGFEGICEGLVRISKRGDCQIVFPVHLNPNVKDVVYAKLKGNPFIWLLEPIEYREMVYLMTRASFLLTDSGGLQEEGPALGKPVLVMRDVTERPEAMATGAVRLVGTDPNMIRQEADKLLDNPDEYAIRSAPTFPYGDGTAATQIVRFLEKELID